MGCLISSGMGNLTNQSSTPEDIGETFHSIVSDLDVWTNPMLSSGVRQRSTVKCLTEPFLWSFGMNFCERSLSQRKQKRGYRVQQGRRENIICNREAMLVVERGHCKIRSSKFERSGNFLWEDCSDIRKCLS